MTAPLVFMDTETTGLLLTDDIWEFAAIRREPDGTENEVHLFIEHDRKKCAHLPESFREDHYDRFRDHRAVSVDCAINEIQHVFAPTSDNVKAHVVGAVPNFDTERIAKMCADNGRSVPSWHYHLIDVENLAVGYLAAGDWLASLPWNSDEVAAVLGVTIDEAERHTAMGDARWAMRIYDEVMRGVTLDAAEYARSQP